MSWEAIHALPDETDPATLFGMLWPLVEPRVGEIIAEPWDPLSAREFDIFHGKLIEANGPGLPSEFLPYLRGDRKASWSIEPEDPAKRGFLLMRVIDRAFRVALPETAYTWSGTVCVKPGQLMLRMHHRYLSDGHLAAVGSGLVAMLGPMTGLMRADAPEARNGDQFEHQFVNITVVPPLAAGRKLVFKTFAPSEFPHDSTAPSRVGLAPIAQDEHDLIFTTAVREPHCYIDARPHNSEATAIRTAEVVCTMLADGARLVALPELVLDKEAIGAVRSNLRIGAHDGGRIVVLGTGLSEMTAGGASSLHYNEAVVVDGRGRILFRQRKLNHYSMTAQRMRDCKISPERDVAHIENCATGSDLVICDLPGVGRLMVLICEDFAQARPGRHAAQLLSPDWIITPILDIEISTGRWTQQKSFSLGTVAKIVVSGSTTLSVRKADLERFDQLETDAGVAMLFEFSSNRAASRIVTAGAMLGHSHAKAIVDWHPDTWPELRFGEKAP